MVNNDNTRNKSADVLYYLYSSSKLGATEGNVYIVTSSFSEQGIVGKKQMLSDYT